MQNLPVLSDALSLHCLPFLIPAGSLFSGLAGSLCTDPGDVSWGSLLFGPVSISPRVFDAFWRFFTTGSCSSSVSESVSTSSEDFGGFLGCVVLLTGPLEFFPAFVDTFFPSAFLGLCYSLLESSMGFDTFLGSSDFDIFLGCETFMVFLLHLL